MRRTVLVTGGARRLGAAIARRLADDGFLVVIHCHRSTGDAEALAAAIDGAVIQADLGDPAAAGEVIAAARKAAGGPVHALVNSASAFEYDAPPAIDPALFRRMHAVNAAAPVALACALAGQNDLDRGAVVNLLDQKLANLNPDFFSYTCAKAALAAATTMLAQALGPRVAVNAVSPGLTLPSADQSEEEFAAVASRNLLARPIGAAAVAEAVAYLIGSRRVTGQNLFVDGGQRFVKRARDVMFDRERVHG